MVQILNMIGKNVSDSFNGLELFVYRTAKNPSHTNTMIYSLQRIKRNCSGNNGIKMKSITKEM